MSETKHQTACAPLPERGPHQAADILLSNSTEVCFLDKLQVLRIVPVSPTGLHELMVSAGFPRPFVLRGDPASTTGKSYWMKSEVVQWMLSRPKRVSKLDRAQEVAND